MYGSFEIFPMSLCREIPRRSRCQSRALALDLPSALKSRRVNQLSSHPRMPRPDFMEVNSKERGKGAAEEEEGKGDRKGIQDVDWWFPQFSPFGISCFFGGNEGHARVKTRRKGTREDYPLFAVQYARSLSFSRLARRESTACFSESSPWFEATTLPRYSCSWTATALPLPSSVLSLLVFLSRSSFRTRHLLTSFVSLSFSFCLPWKFDLRLAILLCSLCSIFVFRLSSSSLTPSSSTRRHAVLPIYTQFRITRSCPSMTARIGRSPIFLNTIADKLF